MKSAFGLTVPGDLQEMCSPDRAAIIVYDMQAAIVPQIADGQLIVKGCRQLLAAARSGGYRIFYTRHIFLPNAAAGVGQFRRAMVWQRKDNPMDTKPLFTATSPASQIVPELAATGNDVVIEKITMSAFEGTYLDIAFRDANLQTFIIVGIAWGGHRADHPARPRSELHSDRCLRPVRGEDGGSAPPFAGYLEGHR